MNKKLIGYIFGLTLIIFIIISVLFHLFDNLKYGLDLQGGFEVLYQVESLDDKDLTKEMVTNTYKIINKRIDVLGVSEPDIVIEGKDKIRVKLAGVTNKEEAREILSKTASLTFRDTNNNLLMTSSVLKAGLAKLTTDEQGQPAVLLTIADKDKFYKITNQIKNYSDNRIVIWLDFEENVDSYINEQDKCGSLGESKCLSAATVNQAFASNVQIEGNFTKEEASLLVDLINSGSIPTKLTEISSHTVGASFGKNTLNKTFIAGIIGISLIILFMSIIYHLVGFISGVSILIYTCLVFSIFWLIDGVLTLPGIASLILGIGMAIDASVLSFERIKEELWEGKSLFTAFNNGYKRSFTTILDANITTFIVAVILFVLGESSVKGFATMLIITIIVTLIVMVWVTKYLLKKLIKTNYFDKKLNLFINVKQNDIPNLNKNEKIKKVSKFKILNFLSKRKYFIIGSLSVIVVGIIFSLLMGLNLGIDYLGGSNITLITPQEINLNDIKADFNDFNYEYNSIELIDNNTAYIKLNNVLNKDEIKIINDYFNNNYNANTKIGVISNIVKKQLTINAIYSIIFAIIGIVIYVSIRFKFSYAISAIIALLHDILIVLALFSIFRLEISVIFIAAILTIIGYSINDTVVIFDRIREKISNNNEKTIDLYNIINLSLVSTIKRSIYTSLTTLIPILCLMILGTYELINFNIALFIGIIIGTYSSLFFATPILYQLEKKNINKKPKKTYYDELDEIEIKGINS